MSKINQISVDGVVYDIATKKEVELEAKIYNKADKATTLYGYGITDAYTKDSVDGMLSQKNDILTFDTTPTADSTNPVTSGGVKTELDKKVNKSDIFSSRGVGVQIGENSKASSGVSIGYNSQSGQYTVAIGNDAKGDGVSIGSSAKCYDGTKYINAIQLGTGTNSEEKTAQFYDYKIMKSDGNIPVERLTELKKLSIPHTTASGYPVSVSDHLEGESVIDYKVYGNSVQDGTPTPDTPIEIQSVGDLVTDTSSPYYGKYDVPVTVRGKNILTYPYKDATKTIAGITFTDNGDGTITASGTATAAATYRFYDTGSNETKRIYISSTVTLSGCPTGGGKNSYKMGIDIYDEDGNHQYYLDYGDGCTITKTGKSSICYIVIPTGMTVSNLVFKPQLEFGSSATPYEPYSGETKHIFINEPLRKVGDYVDYVDWGNQVVVRNVGEQELLSSSNYTAYNDGNAFHGFGININSMKFGTRQDGFCTHLQNIPNNSISPIWFGVNGFKIYMLFPNIYNSAETDTERVAAFKAYLTSQSEAGTPVRVVYPLKTPTTEPITVPELTAPNSTVMNISSQTATQPSQIDLTYYQDINKVITNLTNAVLAQGGNV